MNHARKFDFLYVVSIASITLLLGIAYYWFTRPHDSALFLALLPESSADRDLSFLSHWLGWLPTFLHVFAFSLLTFLALGRGHLLFACMLWGAINALFELGQAMPPGYTGLLPDLLNIHSYFAHGVFDPLDLIACIVGAWAAWFIARNRIMDTHQSRL
jgi:hypothetical protein